MEFTLLKPTELTAQGYKDLGIFTHPSKELDELVYNKEYDSILIRQLDSDGNIFSVFVK